MQFNQSKNPFIKLSVTTALALVVSFSVNAADVSGLWKWTTPGRNGGPERLYNLELKNQGEVLTGKIYTPNRTNETFSEVAIKNGKLNGSGVYFETVRTGRSGTNFIVTKYSGELAVDKIVGTIEAPGRDGATQTSDWKVERNTTGKLLTGPIIQIKPGYDELGRKIVNETHFKELPVDEVEKFIAAHPDAIILDTRAPSEFAAGHLPKAQNHNLTDEATYKDVLAKLDKNKTYVVHSAAGHYRTVRALEYFEANGFKNAIALDGGYNAWAAAGKPTVK